MRTERWLGTCSLALTLGATACGSDSKGGAGGGVNLVRTNTCLGAAIPLPDAMLPAGYCAWEFATDVQGARGITVASNGDVLVVARGQASVVALWDDDRNGVADQNERATIAQASGLNHGISVHDGYLYASSEITVYRWAYTPGTRTDLGNAETVITGLPTGGHSTRTLMASGDWLYVSIGSAANVDGDSTRARMVRFSIAALPSALGAAEVFADGLRNEVGLGFDGEGRLWGVGNGVDSLSRVDLGGDIHEDNPAEELHLFETAGSFYGYPYCWSEYRLAAGLGRGTRWAHPNFMSDGTHDDAWCRDTNNVVAPKLSMQAHSAPLDVTFYQGPSFPADVVGDAFVSFHGSWNRDSPTGYKVVRVPFENGWPTREDPVPVLEYGGAGDIGASWPHRPVGIAVGSVGQLLVTSDASSRVIAIGYDPG